MASAIVCAATVTIFGFQEESVKTPDATRLATGESVPPATAAAGAGTTSPSASSTAAAEATPVPVPTVPVDFSSPGTEPVISLGAEVNTPLSGGPIFQASVLNRREAQISFTQLAGIRAAGKGTLLLDLGLPAGPVPAVFSSVVENADGGCSYVGKVQGAPSSEVILTQQDQVLVGDIFLSPTQDFALVPGPPGAGHELRRMDRSVMPGCDRETAPETSADAAPAPGNGTTKVSGESSSSGGTSPSGGGCTACVGTQPVVETTIDTMILYTQSSLDFAGSEAALIATMNQAVTKANKAFLNSGVSCALRLVYHQLVTFSATTTDLPKDTGRLAAYQEALDLRDLYAADNVSLWHNYQDVNNQAGNGYVNTTQDNVKKYGFNVVDVEYAESNYSWVHEIGHNLGLRHERTAYTTTPGTVTPNAFGHLFVGASDGVNYRTVMGSAGGGGTRVNYFSNPGVSYKGTATGSSTENCVEGLLMSKDWAAATNTPVSPAITSQSQDTTVNSGSSVTLSCHRHRYSARLPMAFRAGYLQPHSDPGSGIQQPHHHADSHRILPLRGPEQWRHSVRHRYSGHPDSGSGCG